MKVSPHLQAAQLAQSEERSAFNRVVVGSIPTLGANYFARMMFANICSDFASFMLLNETYPT